MYHFQTQQFLENLLKKSGIKSETEDHLFFVRFTANVVDIQLLYSRLYGHLPGTNLLFEELLKTIIEGYKNRSEELKMLDLEKEAKSGWFLSNKITGMSLYVDRFCGNLKNLSSKLDYFETLGVNLLHLMPLMESPVGESDGGYAVSNFRKVDPKFGDLQDLKHLQKNMEKKGFYLMLDIVLNHTSQQHEWAQKAKKGEKDYQDFYYLYSSRELPDQFDRSMPEIFPESSPGNFTYLKDCKKWVMTVFHSYQWDLNYSNPVVFMKMLDNIYFYANLGVDILRVDAPAFIWKQLGTSCQNLPQAHTLLKLIKLCVQIASPGMAILGEAIVAPSAILPYFGTGWFLGRECDLAYNATQMALQWDALATGNTQVMLSSQHDLLQKPYGASWITYTRCHDDIGLGYEDESVRAAGKDPWEHKKFIKNYYTGNLPGSDSMGALFSYNPKNQDARISGSLASLCGLEKAIQQQNQNKISLSIQKILLMQAQSFFISGIPMLFYGDEVGYTNQYDYLSDPAKNYDNRWMHRPLIDWKKNDLILSKGSIEERIFSGTQNLIRIRKNISTLSDLKNIIWLNPHNDHIAGFIRWKLDRRIYCLFNYHGEEAYLTWFAFKEHGKTTMQLKDWWEEKNYVIGPDHEYLILKAYSFMVLEEIIVLPNKI